MRGDGELDAVTLASRDRIEPRNMHHRFPRIDEAVVHIKDKTLSNAKGLVLDLSELKSLQRIGPPAGERILEMFSLQRVCNGLRNHRLPD
jgi:hypothetical protein